MPAQAPQGGDAQDRVPAPAQAPPRRRGASDARRPRRPPSSTTTRSASSAATGRSSSAGSSRTCCARSATSAPRELVQLSGPHRAAILDGDPAPAPLPDRLGRVFGRGQLRPRRCAPARRGGAAGARWSRRSRAGVFGSFRITARRAFKTFPLTSVEINRELGAHVLARRPDVRVSLEHPELNVRVEVLPGRGLRLRRPPARPGRAAGGHGRDGGGPALGRHRLAGGGVAAHEAGLPRGLRALPQRAVPARPLAGQGARPGGAAHRSGSTSRASSWCPSARSSARSCCRCRRRSAWWSTGG